MARQKAATKPKRRKAVRKEELIPVRCTEEQKQTLANAAQAAGLGVSTWLLMVGLKAAKEAERADRE